MFGIFGRKPSAPVIVIEMLPKSGDDLPSEPLPDKVVDRIMDGSYAWLGDEDESEEVSELTQ